jgi:hypothetical protein
MNKMIMIGVGIVVLLLVAFMVLQTMENRFQLLENFPVTLPEDQTVTDAPTRTVEEVITQFPQDSSEFPIDLFG